VEGDHEGPLTSRTIATLSGVSQTTVSRVLAGHPSVSDATRSRVLGVLAETGYTPNAAAQAMRRRRSGVLGVVVGRVTNPFFPELAEALHREITRHGLLMNLWISDGGEDDAGERAALDALRRRAIDGVVYTTATATSPSLLEALGGAAPVVLLNRTLPGVAVDSVSSDNAGGAVALARHFLALGHRRIGLIAGPEGVSTSAEREREFLAALAAAGAEALAVRGDFTHASGVRGIEALARSPGGAPTAVFAINDVVAFGVIDGARRLGLDVPARLSVAGYDDTEMAAWPGFDLTTVRQQTARMAGAGVERLLERIAGEADEPRQRRLEGELVIRSSTAPVPSG
jgi:LacI family transcriptional regulator